MIKVKYIIIYFCSVLLSYTTSYAQNGDHFSFFDKTVQDLLQERITDPRVIVEPEYNSQSKSNSIRQKEDNIKTVTLQKFDPRTSSFEINITYSNGQLELLSGKYISYIEIPVAARNIKYGEVIQSIDINNLKVKLDTIKNGEILTSGEVVGMQAKTYIAMRAIIKKADIANPSVLKNGDPVNIIYSSGTINLKTTGIALGSGAVGDMVKVKNSTSGIILLGQIVNKNTVQVSGNNDE